MRLKFTDEPYKMMPRSDIGTVPDEPKYFIIEIYILNYVKRLEY